MINNNAYGGFSVDNLAVAKDFYENKLGVATEEHPMGMVLKAGNGIFVYQKDDHQPSTYTVLNFPTDDIDSDVAALKAKGVEFESYPPMTGEDNIARGMDRDMGPNIAWFKDPAGNILSILQDK